MIPLHAHPYWAEVAAPALPGFVGAGALGLLALGSVLVYLVAYGLHEGWDHTIGWGFRWVANRCRDVGFTVPWIGWHFEPLAPLADFLEWIDGGIQHSLATVALDAEKASVYLWHLTGIVFWWSVHETKALSLDVYHALRHMVVVTIPDAAKWAHREAIRVSHAAVREEAALRRTADHEIRHLARVAEADAIDAYRHASHALHWSEEHVGSLEHELGGLKARLEQLTKQLSPAAIVALIGATIFTDFGLGWLRCSNVGRMGRFLCGLPLGLLDDLLELAIIPLIATDICRFADEVESLALVFKPALLELVDVEDALIGCHGATAPPPLLPPGVLHLPPRSLGLALAD